MFKKIDSDLIYKITAVSITVFVFTYLFQEAYKTLGEFSDIILIVILSWLVSFMFEPLVGYLENLKFNRLTAALLVFGVFSWLLFLLILWVIPVLIDQINTLTTILPKYVGNAPSWANRIFDFILSALSNSVDLIQKVASFLFYFIAILMMSFYLIVDKEKIWKGLLYFVPRKYRDELDFLHKTVNSSFTNFLRAQVILGIIFGLFTLVFLMFFSPGFAILAGILAGAFTILPLVGPVLALVPPFLVLLPLGFSQSIWLTLILLVFQQLELNLLGPKIYGQSMKMHPLIVLLAFLLGLKLAGIWGSIFAIPVASIISIVLTAVLPHFLNHTGKANY